MDIGDLAGRYALTFKALKAEWYAGCWGEVEGGTLAAAKQAREGLRHITFETIVQRADRRALWINLYNGAMVDRAVGLGVRHSVKEVRGFFSRRWLPLAGEQLSLDDIEHGFLRGKRPAASRRSFAAAVGAAAPAAVGRPAL